MCKYILVLFPDSQVLQPARTICEHMVHSPEYLEPIWCYLDNGRHYTLVNVFTMYLQYIYTTLMIGMGHESHTGLDESRIS